MLKLKNSILPASTEPPIILFLYKRTANFTNILSSIKIYKPCKLYLIADGPRKGEARECLNARDSIEKLIDWPCKIYKNYSDTNLGLKERFRTGLDWVFESEDTAIIIEDDCIPDSSFFPYCQELLEKYKDDDRIASISGNNFLFSKLDIKDSYYFSRYPLIWGWATWRRAWHGYDPDLRTWDVQGKNKWLRSYIKETIPYLYWRLIFNLVKTGEIRTWDYQFTYHCFRNKKLHIVPNMNLVTNVGDDGIATNTKIKSRTIGVKSSRIRFPLKHPRLVSRNSEADRVTEKNSFITPIIATSLVVKSLLLYVRRLFYVR